MTPRGPQPLGHRAYVKIPHLPGSRTGASDRHAPRELARWCTHQCRPGDTVVVQEKLDGSCVAVAKKHGEVLALGREGFLAASSQNPGRQLFGRWVAGEAPRFGEVLREGEWLVGEWLALAHSTRYRLAHEPFVALDLCSPAATPEAAQARAAAQQVGATAFVTWATAVVDARLQGRFARPHVLHRGGAISIEAVEALLGEGGFHGATERVEGAVWRVERAGAVVFRAKFVRPGKVDGALLPENSGLPAVWNWSQG